MTDETIVAVRQASFAYAEAVRTTQRFFDRIEDPTDPAVLAEYAALAEQEKEANDTRLDAIAAAGFGVPSIDQTAS
ncbi:hypothetical protein [Actinoplanes siamensis]|nr:hypothetical protein [Actinoplanes siamensis]